MICCKNKKMHSKQFSLIHHNHASEGNNGPKQSTWDKIMVFIEEGEETATIVQTTRDKNRFEKINPSAFRGIEEKKRRDHCKQTWWGAGNKHQGPQQTEQQQRQWPLANGPGLSQLLSGTRHRPLSREGQGWPEWMYPEMIIHVKPTGSWVSLIDS